MFVADVMFSQATWQTVPNSQTGSAKTSVSEVVRTWHRTHVIRGRPKGSWLPGIYVGIWPHNAWRTRQAKKG